jgi:Protein of unknown function (DUF3309)
MGLILLIILVVLLLGAVPQWGYSRSWGYGPSGLLGGVVPPGPCGARLAR